MNLLEEFATRLALLGTALLVHLDEVRGAADGSAKLDDRAGAELVGVEVGETDGDELNVKVGVRSHGAEGHDGETGLEGQEVGTVVRAALWEDADAVTLVERVKHGAVRLLLIDMGQKLVLGPALASTVVAHADRGLDIRVAVLGGNDEFRLEAHLGV